MTFESDKKKYLAELYKPDKSKKGNVDVEITHVIDAINKKENFYTTSSCAGRISIIKIPKSGRKDEAEWFFVSHAEIKFDELKDALKKVSETKEAVWFREEAPILHICARTIEDAQKITNIAKQSGFKRSGIMSTKKRFMVEMTSTEFLDTIIAKEGNVIVTEDYIKILAAESNKKLRRARQKLERFFEGLKKI